MEGFGQNRTEKELTPKTRNEKLESAQEILAPIFRERLNPDEVINYLMEENNSSFEGSEERDF